MRPERVKRPSQATEVDRLIVELHRLYGAVDMQEHYLVDYLRSIGASWADVGQAFEMTGEAARQRFGRRNG